MRWAVAWTFDETLQFSSQCQTREALQVFK